MKEEISRIMKMVQEGKLSPEDAAELIDAFSSHTEPVEEEVSGEESVSGFTEPKPDTKGKGDKGRVTKYGCVIHTGLGKLMSWQVGHPRAIGLGATEDPKAIGGVQNHNVEPGLRIDVVQHQMKKG